uniref:mRNA interferase RelE/StbE n=1 Tax=Candidatus Kentrum sp. SD TaxID=2126332 RepID=A0A451BMZ7_9GAMM|nr:MAG: mRNA interferase RelE/StbE [Candidatus Kentron sp. SD]
MPKQDMGALSEFRIFETDEFRKKIGKLPDHDAQFLQRKLTEYVYPQLRTSPFLGRNIKKLKGYQPSTWRYRIGRFRVFFIVNRNERIVSMLSVDARRDAYK